VVLDEEDFRRADVKATQTVDIMNCLRSRKSIRVFRPTVLSGATKSRRESLMLFCARPLNKTGKVRHCQSGHQNRQHLAAIKPEERALVLELMHFSDELVEPSSLPNSG